jgi:hypothetical protein
VPAPFHLSSSAVKKKTNRYTDRRQGNYKSYGTPNKLSSIFNQSSAMNLRKSPETTGRDDFLGQGSYVWIVGFHPLQSIAKTNCIRGGFRRSLSLKNRGD